MGIGERGVMLSLSLPLDIWLCVEPTDMRCGYDRLAQRALDHARRDVLAGGLFVFFNRRRDRVKLLYWDQDGYAMWQKKLKSDYPHFFLFTEIGECANNLAHQPAAAG
jgi:transposase